MSKRRYFVLDEDISIGLRPIFSKKAKVVSIREFMRAAPDADVIEEALKREAVLVTNDSGLVAQYKGARRRTREDACYPGLIHLRSEKELVQARMLKEILKKYVWNEVIEQDCLVTVALTGADKVTVRHESLCHHEGYERKPVVRKVAILHRYRRHKMVHEILHEMFQWHSIHEILHLLSGCVGSFFGTWAYFLIFQRRRIEKEPRSV